MNPLEPQPMTPDQVRWLVRRVRMQQAGGSDANARAQRARWERYREAKREVDDSLRAEGRPYPEAATP